MDDCLARSFIIQDVSFSWHFVNCCHGRSVSRLAVTKAYCVKSNTFFFVKGLEQFCATNSKKLYEVLCLLGLPEIMHSRGPVLLEEDEAFTEPQAVLKRGELCHQ